MATSLMMPKLADQLNDIIQYLYDSEQGYKKCAEVISDERLKPVLENESRSRTGFIHALENVLNNLGKDPVHQGSLSAPLHRIFIDIKALVTQGDPDQILNEIKRGDNILINAYKEVLREPLPPALLGLLELQTEHIKETLTELDSLSVRH